MAWHASAGSGRQTTRGIGIGTGPVNDLDLFFTHLGGANPLSRCRFCESCLFPYPA
uniref:Uncharacterized protein n=1 Tax=Arundo donax TaxID=35708 RepID=A0A0A9AB05_ARUDO